MDANNSSLGLALIEKAYKNGAASSREPFKGIVHQFWIYNIFSCLNLRNIFYKRSISIKQLWLETIEKIGAQSQSVLYM